MKQLICISAIMLATMTASACATLFNDSQRSVSMSSNPTGAEVWINGTMRGTTPISLDMNNHESLVVSFRKDGYDDVTCAISASVGAGWVILDILGGLLPVIVDAATGAWYSLNSSNCNVVLPMTGNPSGTLYPF